MVIFHYALLLPTPAYVVIIAVIVAIIVVIDIAISSKLISFQRGKLSPLKDKDPILFEMINEEWDKISNGKKKLSCHVMKGFDSHSNCYVDSEKVVIYESMFEHIRERHHMMAILRHEFGH